MRVSQTADGLWLLRRYLGVSLVAHLGWEMLQLPLYTLWSTGTLRQQAFAVFHCTLGDLMIAGLSLLLALALLARATWPRESLPVRIWRPSRSGSATRSIANG